VQAKRKALLEYDCARLKLPHSFGCRATHGRGAAALDCVRAIGDEGGVIDEASDAESKLPVDDPEHPRDDTGRRCVPDSLF